MNYRPLLSRLSIVNKDGITVPFTLNWAQEEYVSEVERQESQGKPIRLIVLKARQLGISTLTEGIIFTKALIEDNMTGLVLASEIDNGQHLLSMTENYWQTYPFKKLYDQKYASRNELAWMPNRSSIKVGTPQNARVGRGKTIRSLHASEIAFWDKADVTMLALSQAIPARPGTFVCLESTANGVGNYFYNMWQMAVQGDVDYTPLFFPWHRHPEYTAEYINIPYESLGALDAEEKLLRQMGIGDNRLAWRRWAIRNLTGNDIHKFHQEYPSTPDEAFIATGTNVFPIGKLAKVYEPRNGIKGRLVRDSNARQGIRFQSDIQGPLTIFRNPSSDEEWGKYFVAGDPTHTTRGDYACAQIINRRTLEQVGVYRGRIDPGSFAEEIAKMGQFYNNAIVTSEFEGPGAATIARLIAINYHPIWMNRLIDTTPGKTGDHHGWRTTMQSKEMAVGTLLKVLVDAANAREIGMTQDQFTIHDRQTFVEMRDFVTLEGGGYGNAAKNGHDDTVMALAIAITCHILEPPIQAYGQQSQEAPWENWGSDDQEAS